MPQNSHSIAKYFTCSDLEKYVRGGECCSRYKEADIWNLWVEEYLKHSGVGWLMPSCVDALHTDNGRLRAVKQLIAKCRNQRALVVAHKQALITCSRRAKTQ